MPLVQTRGAASAQGFGEFAQASAPVYIEEVFSCFLYDGNNTVNTITNNIDLSTKGGLVWIKGRTATAIVPTFNHVLYDTTRGTLKLLESNTTDAEEVSPSGLTSFTSTGFVLGSASQTNIGFDPSNIGHFVSWTFRKQPKFFDIVTYTGNGTARNISHNLGSVPGFMIIKDTTNAGTAWAIYHTSLGNTKYLQFTSAAAATSSSYWNNTTPTSTEFTVGTNGNVNQSGATYIAYLFAHNAGGFGLAGTDNVISCGSYTGNGAAGGQLINLGYEAQWVMIKQTNAANNWWMMDTMRGWFVNGDFGGEPALFADLDQNQSNQVMGQPSAQGFTPIQDNVNQSGQSYIYIAIRRGPMKVPTVGTSVFGIHYRNGTGANSVSSVGSGVSDALLVKNVGASVASLFASRLTSTGYLVTSDTAAEVAAGATILQASPWDLMDGVKLGTTSTITNATSNTYINYMFGRSSSFFDEVCYTGNGGTNTLTHNLGVAPELIIFKSRSAVENWVVFADFGPVYFRRAYLDLTNSAPQFGYGGSLLDSAPTATTISLLSGTGTNSNAATYVAYLFATCAGVSKVGSYTGTGAVQTINCGFTTGARFVLIKITNTTGNWFVFDTERGMTVGTNPSLALNSTAAENPGSNISTTSVGFTLAASPSYPVNSNGYNYIFLAIA